MTFWFSRMNSSLARASFSPRPILGEKILSDQPTENKPTQPQAQVPDPQPQPTQTQPTQTTPLKAEVQKQTPAFHLKLKAKVLAAIFTAIAVIVDEATFTISSGSVNLRAMDPSRVAMVAFNYPKEAFDEFGVDREGKICFNIDEALKIVKRAGNGDVMELVMPKEPTLGRLLLTIKIHGKFERTFELPILEAAEEEIPDPKINFDTTVRMTVQGLRNAIEDAQLVSDQVHISATPAGIRFQATGDQSSVDAAFAKGMSEDLFDIATTQGAKAVFSLEYLTEIVKKLVDVAEQVTLEMATDMPIKLEAQNVKGSMVFYQAPRIEVEQ